MDATADNVLVVGIELSKDHLDPEAGKPKLFARVAIIRKLLTMLAAVAFFGTAESACKGRARPSKA
jgi:hypothetical protein